MAKLRRGNIISIFVLLMVSLIFILHVSLVASLDEANEDYPSTEIMASIPVEEGVFQRAEYALDYGQMPEDSLHGRELEKYYANRAYAGAPPRVPHPMITSGISIGDKGCLQCHENGGYVRELKAYTPVTPHPELINCNQCHVPVNTEQLFRESTFERAKPPKTGNTALEGSPPVIPYTLVMRENCLSCHAGPSAPKEIKVSHPERINCRQCHVPNNTVEAFNRMIENHQKREPNE
jgi:nitrate reductase (cytochrome), electron transfer subunit